MDAKKGPIRVKLTKDSRGPIINKIRMIVKKGNRPSIDMGLGDKKLERFMKAVDKLRREGGDIKIIDKL